MQRCQQFQRKQYVIPNSMCHTCIRVFTLAIIKTLFVLLSRQLKQKMTFVFPRMAKDPRFERLPCMHKGTYADNCIVNRIQQVRLLIPFLF